MKYLSSYLCEYFIIQSRVAAVVTNKLTRCDPLCSKKGKCDFANVQNTCQTEQVLSYKNSVALRVHEDHSMDTVVTVLKVLGDVISNSGHSIKYSSLSLNPVTNKQILVQDV